MSDANLAPIEHDEPRLLTETGVDARVANLIELTLNSAGFRLVRVRLSGMNGMTLQIMAERADGTMTVEDCETVSRMISPVLDVEDLIAQAYHLEISSPGIDRPLVRISDFSKWRGHIAKVETSAMVNGRRKFRGTIIDVTPEHFVLERDVPAIDENGQAEIPFSLVADARLILTDELIRASLSAAKMDRPNQNFDDNSNSNDDFSAPSED